MALVDHGRTWDEAQSPTAERWVRSYEAAWRANPASPPEPEAFLPEDLERRSGVLLALLRADLAFRRATGRPAPVEWYCRDRPDLSDDVLVALAYEEFCLREEEGEAPAAAEYEARFPRVAARLRELFDIHEMVESAGTLLRDSAVTGTDAPAFPDCGRTIGGFRLVEELGRGSFARVFLAREGPLADRLVALKITRAGSPEPQTLARLQHTNIVPVHSYRVDLDSGLHLLCMPYFGRLTLAHVIARLRSAPATGGADLVKTLDRLRSVDEPASRSGTMRNELARRSLARAVALWGARLAEALQHAHDQGVLHRDVKPSNILVTSDATPMLLDFNLSQPGGPLANDSGLDSFGGTLAYMAPEHIEALVGRGNGPVDGRADVYALGLVLFEILAENPFATPGGARLQYGALIEAIARRRAWTPQSRSADRPISAPLEAVLRRCLAPDPADRYATAADLAADLHAVADDGPLRFAREPQPGKSLRWARRHRQGVVLGLVLTIAAALGVAAGFRAQADVLRRESRATRAILEGRQSAREGEFVAAAAQFALAEEWAAGSSMLHHLKDEARASRREAIATGRARDEVDAFFRRVEPLRFRLIQRKGLKEASRDLATALKPLGVLDDSPTPWPVRPGMERLDDARRVRLTDEVNELLFLWVVASDAPGDPERARRAVAVCDRALAFAEPPGPWRALRAHYDPGTGAAEIPDDPRGEESPRACLEWGLLRLVQGRPERTLGWFERAVRLRPDGFWHQFALAHHYSSLGDADRAREHYEAAVALRPDSAWALFNRAQLYWSRKGAWERARADLDRVEARPDGIDPALIRLERGLMAHKLGDFPAALAAYRLVIETDPGGDPARRARLNRAGIEAERGDWSRVRDDYEQLPKTNSVDRDALLGTALLAQRLGQAEASEAALTRLLARTPEASRRSEALAARALARLALKRPEAAASDAAEALRLQPSPGRRRLRDRTAAAFLPASDLAALRPDDVDRWPARGPDLATVLQADADRLRADADGPAGESTLAARRARAILLSTLGRHAEALVEADRAVAVGPFAVEPLWTRAQVRRRAGDLAGALADLGGGLVLAPDHLVLREGRGRLLTEAGKPSEGLAELDKAVLAGAGESAHAARATALRDLGRLGDAVREWTRVLDSDPEDADALLDRARCFQALGHWDQAMADLEGAAAWSNDRPRVLAKSAAAYALCLPGHPNRLPRVVALARRAVQAWRRAPADSVAGG